MSQYNRFIFSGTLFRPYIFRLRLFRAFFNAQFTQNKFSTELNSPISAAHFTFATIFQYLNSVRFCSYSKLQLPYGCQLQWWKPFVDIFFQLWEIGKQTLGIIQEKALYLGTESVNMRNTWGGGGGARGQKSLQIHSYCIPFVFITIYFLLRSHF